MAYTPNADADDTLPPENPFVLLIARRLGLMPQIDDMPAETAKDDVLGLAQATTSPGCRLETAR